MREVFRRCYARDVRSIVAAIITVACSLVVGSPARAGESNDQVDLIARIEDAVHAIATALQTPSAHMTDDATGHSREVRELVAQLAPIKGDDAHAAEIVARYPRYDDAVDAGLARLKQLGQEVHRADGVADRCAKDDAALHALLKKHADPDPARDLEAFATKAVAYGKTWAPTLAELATIDATVAADVAATRLALTDGYWMAIATNLAADGQAAASLWTDRYQAATTACEQLALGAEHVDVVPVLAELRARSTASHAAAAQVVHDYNAWLASVRSLRELAIKNREAVRDAICTTTDGALGDRAASVATSWSRDLAEQVAAASDEATRLGTHAADNAGRTRAIRDGLRANGAIVAAISRDEALGRQNPKLRAALAAISQRRDRVIAGYGCSSRSIDVAANDCGATACRIACIKPVDHTCTLAEPVPDNDAAKADGFARGQRELAGLQAWYSRDKSELFSKIPTLRRCEIAERATLDLFADVVTYKACASATAGDFGEPLAEVTADLAP